MSYSLKTSLGYNTNLVATTIKTVFSKMLSPYGIAAEQFATLKMISENSQTTQTEIAKILGKNKTTIGRSIDSLLKKELIIRDDLDKDRRANVLYLTKKGEDILKQTIPLAQNYNQTIKSKLSKEEIDTFFKVLETMIEVSNDFELKEGEK